MVLLDADRGDLKTKFHLTSEEEQLFKGIDINIQFVNDRFLEKRNWIENEIKKIQPDIIFTFSAANYSYRCISPRPSLISVFMSFNRHF